MLRFPVALCLFLRPRSVSADPQTQQSILPVPPARPISGAASEIGSDWTAKPGSGGTANLIFSSVSGLLKHWPSTVFQNGHTIVPGTVAPGALLYHGSIRNLTGSLPTEPSWVSFDPEHSYLFSSRVYTLQVMRPIKVLYFDGSSASNMPIGTIDTQEILLHGELRRGDWVRESIRIRELCEWGKEFGLEGYLRMEYDFEIMLCDPSAGTEVVSTLDLMPAYRVEPRPPRRSPPSGKKQSDPFRQATSHDASNIPQNASAEVDQASASQPNPSLMPPKRWPRTRLPSPIPPKAWVGSLRPSTMVAFDVIQAGNWHDLPGLTTVVNLDYTRLITFFDPKYTSLVKARRTQTRSSFRAGNITMQEAEVARAEIKGVLETWDGSNERTQYRVSWPGIIQTIKERYTGRLDYLSVLLGDVIEGSSGESHANVTAGIQWARWHVLTMLTPYLPAAATPPVRHQSQPIDAEWLAPTMGYCSTVFTARINLSNASASERLLKNAVEGVTREICRTLGVIWLDAFDVETRSQPEQKLLLDEWLGDVGALKEWLGWIEWSDAAKCNPVCGPHEICTLPQWPFDMDWFGKGEGIGIPYCLSRWWGIE
ncbi:hypothetical protein FRB94_009516 [Tulasnella sp. JGI-2019a]|nr:hypothetical protein FRB94_009516 [Tulasnella sp. JGI-2019a]KAG9007945.1 hypothetical protein FRB93_006964 [Tulasnella sp. JGI-2019a]